MIELEAEKSDEVYKSYADELEPFGKKLFWGSSIIAAAAVVPVLFKKKRTYTVFTPLGNMGAPPLIEPALEPALEPHEIPRLPPIFQLSAEVEEKILRLWNRIATSFPTPELWALGNEIENVEQVHPFALLMTIPKDIFVRIFSNNQNFLYKMTCVPIILNGIGRGINRAISPERPIQWPGFQELLPSFALHMRKEEARINQLILAANWKNLICYLHDIPND